MRADNQRISAARGRRPALRAVWIPAALALAPPSLAQPSTLNLSRDLLTLGIATGNLAPNRPDLDAGPWLVKGDEFTIQDEGVPWTSREILARIRAGDTAVFTSRGIGGDPIHADYCRGLTLRNIRIYSSGTRGLAVGKSDGSLLGRVYEAIARAATV